MKKIIQKYFAIVLIAAMPVLATGATFEKIQLHSSSEIQQVRQTHKKLARLGQTDQLLGRAISAKITRRDRRDTIESMIRQLISRTAQPYGHPEDGIYVRRVAGEGGIQQVYDHAVKWLESGRGRHPEFQQVAGDLHAQLRDLLRHREFYYFVADHDNSFGVASLGIIYDSKTDEFLMLESTYSE